MLFGYYPLYRYYDDKRKAYPSTVYNIARLDEKKLMSDIAINNIDDKSSRWHSSTLVDDAFTATKRKMEKLIIFLFASMMLPALFSIGLLGVAMPTTLKAACILVSLGASVGINIYRNRLSAKLDKFCDLYKKIQSPGIFNILRCAFIANLEGKKPLEHRMLNAEKFA